jgi:hypothetical protein
MILFLMMLCTTVYLHGMDATVELKQGKFYVTGYDTIYSNQATDDGKGGSNISYTGAPLCLIGKFVYADKSEPEEELMIPIDVYRHAESQATLLRYTSDGTCIVFTAHKSRKKVDLKMCPLLRAKIKEALGK